MRTLPAAALSFLVLVLLAAPVRAKDAPVPAAGDARRDAIAWLKAHANPDGSWGRTYTVAVTSLACLAQLAATDEPFEGEGGKPLVRGLEHLLTLERDGAFPKQGHTWIHGQGFAALALSEAYGRARRANAKPDLDVTRLRDAAARAVGVIQKHQSLSGGWWYTPDKPNDHEGSTTVCAVQALVSAANHGIATDAAVLARGFEYLKRCQNQDGGFDYKEGPGETSMKEGTAADVATLALMRKFDYDVMVNGVQFLVRLGAAGMAAERFPDYGHFYAAMGLTLYGEEMAAEPVAKAYFDGAVKDLLAVRAADGSFPLRGWVAGNGGEDAAYSTAFAALVLSVPDRRLSVFQRSPAPLPPAPAAPASAG